MDSGLIPRRYAKALYEVGSERGDNERLYTLMQSLADAFVSQPALAQTVANPFVSESDKTRLLNLAVYGSDSSNVDATYEDFIKLLEKNRRIDMIRETALAYIDLYRKENNIYRVQIASAAPLTDSEKKRLEDIISKHIGKGTMEFIYTIEPGLIGGFTVSLGSQRLDASVSNKLKQLRLQLTD